ncbi:hypothetical protein [Tenacibaculum piscium]|nr:hypothetical protein [Tenacibaculum piscium]MBE7628426.1 hypothetical protein [Tenacibaculum piscium]MBE7686272.1 hypothetical protein [Tenacibaculum piscium]
MKKHKHFRVIERNNIYRIGGNYYTILIKGVFKDFQRIKTPLKCRIS